MAFGTPVGADTTWFYGNSPTGASYLSWSKRKAASMIHILIIGHGGNGGLGVAGANSTAAGGGGGGSGSQTSVLIPACMVPDVLFLSLAYGGSGAASSFVAFDMTGNAQSIVARANGGGNGGNAAGATAGAAGTAGAIATLASMCRGGAGIVNFLVGQAGIIGGTTVAGAAQTAPTTGLYVAGGTGGGGLPAAAATGTAGGGFTGAGVWPSMSGGTSAGASSTGTDGAAGIEDYNGIWLPTPGLGGASGGGTTGGSGSGGNGGPGCGGGGSGGCITGQTVGAAGKGGPALCIITQW